MGIILDRTSLVKRLSDLRSRQKKIVFTNGCFDILHAGHVRYLKEAKGLGDVLVIGINSDDSVARLKPKRPIINETQRAEVLASLECVDYVTIFAEDTPYELIKEAAPDVLVKGGDWNPTDIVGADLVPETVSIKYHEGLSTTAIIQKIVQIYCQ